MLFSNQLPGNRTPLKKNKIIMSNIIPIILVVVMIIIAAFFRGLLWEYGRRFGDKYCSFIKNDAWREWFGVATLVAIIWGGGAILFQLI